ncbi:MAG: hypothetical protein HKP62_05030 [Sulfurovum sp.]|nr:hypothetical protein [Sulfurovum sp.]NNJ45360.1 hypothetical protein [Sulfurovum sp.]
MEDALKEKLKTVVELVNNVMVNPDIEVECCNIGSVETSEAGDPYIHLKYTANGTHVMKQNIPLKHHYINKTPEDIANLVTFYIEQFIEQIDSVEGGAQ